MNKSVFNKNEKGFTLIEIAVVLVILGLIIGTLAPLMVSLIKKDKIKEGVSIVKRARDEIIGYVMTNGKLPISINELGHNRDPWQNKLFFIIDPQLKDKDICSTKKTKLTIVKKYPTTSGKCTASQIIKDVAVIIASKGANFNRQISKPVRNRVYILDHACSGDFFPDGTRRNAPFDDIYEYITINEIKAKACKLSDDSSSNSTEDKKLGKKIIKNHIPISLWKRLKGSIH